jgi:GT2 family glycosyltransferase
MRWFAGSRWGVSALRVLTIEGDSRLVVVVPTPDVSRQLTREFLESVARTAESKPTIVAVESSGPEFHFSKSMNAGIRTALSFGPRYIALSNDDVRPLTAGWDARLTYDLEAHAGAAYAAPVLCRGGAISGPLSVYLFTSLYGLIPSAAFPLIRALRSFYLGRRAKAGAIQLGPGILVNAQPFSVFRSDSLEELSGFDEKFVNGCEDFDLSLRVLERGWKAVLDVDVAFEDIGSATVGKGGFAALYDRRTKANVQQVNNWKLLIKKRGRAKYKSLLKQFMGMTLIVGNRATGEISC